MVEYMKGILLYSIPKSKLEIIFNNMPSNSFKWTFNYSYYDVFWNKFKNWSTFLIKSGRCSSLMSTFKLYNCLNKEALSSHFDISSGGNLLNKYQAYSETFAISNKLNRSSICSDD